MTSKTSTSTSENPLAAVLRQMYRADLLKIASALGSRPRSDHYRDGEELIELIASWAEASELKEDWLLRVEVPWTMYRRLPCLDELEYKTYEELSVEKLREICRQYSISGFSRHATKKDLANKVKELLEGTKSYPTKVYKSRITKEPIPDNHLIFPLSDTEKK
jgi:hypothetical protein